MSYESFNQDEVSVERSEESKEKKVKGPKDSGYKKLFRKGIVGLAAFLPSIVGHNEGKAANNQESKELKTKVVRNEPIPVNPDTRGDIKSETADGEEKPDVEVLKKFDSKEFKKGPTPLKENEEALLEENNKYMKVPPVDPELQNTPKSEPELVDVVGIIKSNIDEINRAHNKNETNDMETYRAVIDELARPTITITGDLRLIPFREKECWFNLKEITPILEQTTQKENKLIETFLKNLARNFKEKYGRAPTYSELLGLLKSTEPEDQAVISEVCEDIAPDFNDIYEETIEALEIRAINSKTDLNNPNKHNNIEIPLRLAKEYPSRTKVPEPIPEPITEVTQPTNTEKKEKPKPIEPTPINPE